MEDKKSKAVKSAKEAVVPQVIVQAPQKELPYTGFLREETIIVQFVPKPTKEIRDPKHIAYGGKLQGTFDHIAPPRLDKGKMKNILTKEEKEGLEYLMGRDLSIYGEFWRGYRKGGLFPIALGKDDVYLDLSVPEDYIKYKVLLNTNLVANSIEQYKNEYRASYRYVMVKENESTKQEEDRVTDKAKAFEFFSSIKDSKDSMRYVLRQLGKHTHSGQDKSFLIGQLGSAIDSEKDRNIILKLTEDKYLKEKILLEEAFSLGIIDRISGQYFTKDNEPIAGDGDEPTESNSARFLGSPVGQEMRLTIEARIKNARE